MTFLSWHVLWDINCILDMFVGRLSCYYFYNRNRYTAVFTAPFHKAPYRWVWRDSPFPEHSMDEAKKPSKFIIVTQQQSRGKSATSKLGVLPKQFYHSCLLTLFNFPFSWHFVETNFMVHSISGTKIWQLITASCQVSTKFKHLSHN